MLYGLLELGIGLAALAVPIAMEGATALYVEVFRGSVGQPQASGLSHALFYLVCSAAILFIPTALMGATLPILARYAVRRESQIGSRVGLLYAINTLGAVGGTVGAGFALLPRLGLEATIWVGVAVNGLVFLAAALLARGAGPVEDLPVAVAGDPAAARDPAGRSGRWILPLVLASGAVSFSYEVLWTRLLGHLLGGSVYAFATMLASFLTGIAAGSALASPFATGPSRAALGFAWSQLGAAILSFGAFATAGALPELFAAIAKHLEAPVFAQAAVAAVTLVPAALCIGATLPFAVRVLARREADAGPASARVIAWNTLGAVVGSIGTGFFLLPALGYSLVLTLGVVTNLALALAAGRPRLRSWGRAGWAAAAAMLAVLLLPPEVPWKLLRASALGSQHSRGRVAYYGVGRSATVLVLEAEGVFRLRTNGLPEAQVARKGAHSGGGTFLQWFAAAPSLARPEARSMLVVGLGGGVVLEAIPSLVESIDVVELEREVIRANRAIAAERREDPLADPRIRLIESDARGVLLLSEKRYDIILSQPSHPWTAGAAHLYTREFFSLARERLTPAGVLAQWMAPAFVDAALLRTLVATLTEVFTHVRIYRISGALLLLASEQPLTPEVDGVRAIAAAPDEFAELGVQAPVDIAAALVLDDDGARVFSAGAPLNTDNRNVLQMRSFAISAAKRPRSLLPTLLAAGDPLVRPDLAWDRVALVQRLVTRGSLERARRVAEAAEDPAVRAASLGLISVAKGRRLDGRRKLESALSLAPDSDATRAALLRLRRRAIVAADPSTHELVGRLAEPDAAVVEGWKAEAAEDWFGLQELDLQLAKIRGGASLHADAIRLRISWRLAAGDRELAAEAVALADLLLPIQKKPAGDLLLRARAKAAAGEPEAAIATLYEVAGQIEPGSDQKIAWAALTLLESLPAGEGAPRERDRLESRLRTLDRASAR
jgi:spermidine synthase